MAGHWRTDRAEAKEGNRHRGNLTDAPRYGYPSLVTTHIQIDGMLGPPDVRAAFTALGLVAGVERAEVVLGRATLEHRDPIDRTQLDQALAVVGLRVVGLETTRSLPLLGE
jgi:hypothetical protein